jgi:hypothetical protein
VIQWLEVA